MLCGFLSTRCCDQTIYPKADEVKALQSKNLKHFFWESSHSLGLLFILSGAGAVTFIYTGRVSDAFNGVKGDATMVAIPAVLDASHWTGRAASILDSFLSALLLSCQGYSQATFVCNWKRDLYCENPWWQMLMNFHYRKTLLSLYLSCWTGFSLLLAEHLFVTCIEFWIYAWHLRAYGWLPGPGRYKYRFSRAWC